MLRNRAVALIFGLIASPLVIALGLGSLQSKSSMNEPFIGRIEILGATADDFDVLRVGLASREQFDRAGIQLNPLLYKLKFTIEESELGNGFISIASKDPVREPYLNFLVEMNWANGRLLREYTVLLDPPLYDSSRPRQQTAAPAPTMPAEAADVVDVAPLIQTSADIMPNGPYRAGLEVGPMVETDTLWSIASLNRPDESVSVQQMMLALLRENPGAFVEGNINLLRRGAILRLPEASSLAVVSASEAFDEVLRQHQLWEQYRDVVGAAPALQPIGATAPVPSTRADRAAQAAAATAARLELIAPEGADSGGAPGTAAGGGSDLLREEIDARSQDNAELGGKLLEAEEIIDLLQRQVNIKDDELAALQGRLAELGIEHGDIEVVDANIDVDDATVTDDAMDGNSLTDEDTDSMGDEAMPAVDEVADGDDVDAASDETNETTDEFGAGDDDAGVDEVMDYDDTATAPERGFPESLIPVKIAGLVPGGALAVLAIVAVVILGLFAAIIGFLMRSRGGDRAEKSPRPAVASVTAPVTDDVSEDPTTTAAPLDDDESEALTDIDKAGADDSFDPYATVEAAAEDAEAPTAMPAVAASAPVEAVEDEEDPLEEMNVYLAYERFDQAEELCTTVIGKYPARHEYKLRLLEVYYSSNDRSAYESAAQNLFNAVGDADPLWDSALAMWSEMSPDRALFEEGGDEEPRPAQDAATAFVDITGDADAAQAGEDTVAHAPGGAAGLDFDLAGGGDDGVLDLTAGDDDVAQAGSSATDGEMLDLTAADDGAVLDLTAEGDAGGVLDISVGEASDDVLDLTDDDDHVLDLTAGDEGDLDISGGDDVLDLTDGGEIDLLDVTSGGSSEVGMSGGLLDVGDANNDTDLLDVTKTGDISSFDDSDLLNVTSPGLNVADEVAAGEGVADLDGSDDLQITDVADDTQDAALDFDISETVATAFDDDVELDASVLADDSDEILDLTGGGASDQNDGDGELLDFDIGELGEAATDVDSEASTMVDNGNLEVDQDSVPTFDLDSAPAIGADSGAVEDELDFDIAMDSEDINSGVDIIENEDGAGRLEITMSSPDEDPIDGEISLQGSDLDDISLGPAGDEDFDFALDGTTEMDSIAADDTLDMGSVDVSGEGELDLDGDASLDELTDQLDGALDDATFDDLEIEGLEFDSDDSSAGEHLQTVAIDGADGLEIEDEDDRTVVMPMSDDVERQSDADEADTKLNLAKAYIELGDAEGARSILDEVASEGSALQQAEAQALLSQLSS